MRRSEHSGSPANSSVTGEEHFELAGYYLDRPHPDRGGAVYACRYDSATGRVRRRSLKCTDWEEAKVKLAALVLSTPATGQAVPGPDQVMTVAALANYLDGHAQTIRTQADAERAAELCKEYLDHIKKPMAPVSSWTPSRQLDFAKWLHQKFGHTPASIERRLDVICAAFREMTEVKLRRDAFGDDVETALMTHAPRFVYKRARIAKDLKIAPSKPRHNQFTIENMASVLDSLEHEHLFRFAILSLNTWARPEAIMDVMPATQRRLGMIDLNPPGRVETNKRRPSIPETRGLSGWLDHWERVDADARREAALAGRPVPPNALLVYQGARVADLKKGLRKSAAAIGITFSPGRFRHFMSAMVRRMCKAVTREQRSLWMGHVVREGSQTTSNYEPEDPEFLEDVALATDFVMQQIQSCCRRKLFSVEVRLNRYELARIGARKLDKSKSIQRDDGGRSRIRTADPLGVNEML